jgi:hypothetical protein
MTIGDDQYRYKFQDISVRKEIRTSWGEWMRLSSGYYSAIQVVNGKITGMEH